MNAFKLKTGIAILWGLFQLSWADKIERLPKSLGSVSDEQGANAAVGLLLRLRQANVNILLVRRVDNTADTWSGQMAFPGGKREANDASLKETVIRETREETAITLADGCRFLGVLTALRSRPRPDLKILPFVVLLEREPEIRLNEKELVDFVWLSLEDIVRNRGIAKLSVGEVPAFIAGNRVIWGLTYQILENFLEALGHV